MESEGSLPCSQEPATSNLEQTMDCFFPYSRLAQINTEYSNYDVQVTD